jgi:hypothetical protein
MLRAEFCEILINGLMQLGKMQISCENFHSIAKKAEEMQILNFFFINAKIFHRHPTPAGISRFDARQKEEEETSRAAKCNQWCSRVDQVCSQTLELLAVYKAKCMSRRCSRMSSQALKGVKRKQ